MSRLDLFNSATVIVTLDSRRSINPPPSHCPLPRLSALCPSLCPLPRLSVLFKAVECFTQSVENFTLCLGASDVRPSLFVHISFRPSLCPSPSVCHLSVRFSVCPFSVRSSVICPSLCPSVCHLFVFLFVCFSVRPSLRPSVILFISVRPSLCPTVSLFVYVRPSVTCPSLCSPCSSRYLSRALVDPVVHCNLSYNVLSLKTAQPAPVSGRQVLLYACSLLFLGVNISAAQHHV